MAKSSEQKAIDDAVKAHLAVQKNVQRAELAKEKLDAANDDLIQSGRVLKWNLAHPALPEDFDVEQHLDEPQPEPFETDTRTDEELSADHESADVVAEEEAVPEVEEKPVPRTRAKAKPEPVSEPVAEADPFGDNPFGE